jgi:5,5'-dehydrodivanillate O-demethylase
MPTAEESERLTRVGPGTPMGELLRRYWHPVAVTSQFQERGTKAVRLLGEDLVLFRDRSGTLGLIGDRCMHRRAGMVLGVPEEEGLRCAYHGWRYAADGRCLEQPYEQTADPNSTYKDQIRIKAYPVRQMAGLIFAYLGPEPVPLLPNWDIFLMGGVTRDIGSAVIPCNWLQIMDNSMDPIHVEWLHQAFTDYVLERLGRPKRRVVRDGQRDERGWRHLKIGFNVFEHGIIKRRVLEGGTEEDEDWTVGHPVIFPNILRISNAVQIRVPIDDTHTWHVWYSTYAPTPDAPEQTPETIPYFDTPVPELTANGPDWSLVDNNSGQDISVWYTQGDITDRTQEHLGASDRGVVLYRTLLREQMEIALRGDDPMNVFRDPAHNVYVELPVEKQTYRFGDAKRLELGGQADKYSPILNQAMAQART